MGSIAGLGRSPGGGHGNPLQYYCLENPMDRGTWQATVHRVTQSQTQLKWLSMMMTASVLLYSAAAAKSLQSCPTLCDPIDGSPPGSPVPGILQARTLEWVAISFSDAWKWKVKVKSLSRVQLLHNPMDGCPPGSFRPWDFPGKSTGMGCHCLLPYTLQPSALLSWPKLCPALKSYL